MPPLFRHIVMLLLPLLSACLPGLLRTNTETAAQLAEPAGLIERARPAGRFLLSTRERLKRPGEALTIYLEGDGLAWITRTKPSSDPTPEDPVALRLAALDSAPNLAWLARPCQYTPHQQNPACQPYYWTHGRFAPEVVDALNEAIDAIKRDAQAGEIHLVGYSGGGGLVALLAARRQDVISLRTIAGNLDTVAFTRFHQVSPMQGSLNPADVAEKTAHIAQRHLIGAEDRIVPHAIAESFRKKFLDARCVTLLNIPAATHGKGWEEAWQRELAHPPSVCR